MVTSLLDIKNNYAQEQGYEDWTELAIINELNADKLDRHWTEICLRAQKAALEKAAKKAKIEHHNTRTNVRTAVDGIGGNGQIYTVDRSSITNENNLIR